jgi:exonuclease III
MKILVWNVKGAKENREHLWEYFSEFDPDIALFQELGSIPNNISAGYSILHRKAYAGNGLDQIFSTALAVKGEILGSIDFSTPWEWVNEELENFKGNIIAAQVRLANGETYNVASVYSPAWPIFKRSRQKEIDVSPVKLKNNPDVWLTEILWAGLKHDYHTEHPWIVAGDLNSSVTFDTLWKGGPRGNQEIQDRMSDLGFTECLASAQGQLTPTFKNPSNKQIIHQLDHLFASKQIFERLVKCQTADPKRVFDESMSDHLAILAEFT